MNQRILDVVLWRCLGDSLNGDQQSKNNSGHPHLYGKFTWIAESFSVILKLFDGKLGFSNTRTPETGTVIPLSGVCPSGRRGVPSRKTCAQGLALICTFTWNETAADIVSLAFMV